MTTNPNTIIEKIQPLIEEIFHANLVLLTDHKEGVPSDWMKQWTGDFEEIIALAQSSERTKSEKACYEKGLNDMYDAAVWASWNYEGVNLREAFKLSLNDKKRKFINGNVENKSKEVRASSEVNPGESKEDA